MELEFVADRRLGGIARYYMRQVGERFVRVPDEIRRCTVFVCCKCKKAGGAMHTIGTAFFLAGTYNEGEKPATEHLDPVWAVAVTARHVLAHIQQESVDDRVWLRANRQGHDAGFMGTPLSAWRFHPTDSSVDAAVLPRVPPHTIFDFRAFHIDWSATPEVIEREGIGLGDEVFIVGLFASRVGEKRNIPIVRVGNIAAMPEEKISTPKFGPIEAYLIEARSIGGLSGSPVFTHLSPVRVTRQGNEANLEIADSELGIFHLLGLVHGHFDEGKGISTGIAIVVPVSKIIEIINQPELVEMKKKSWKLTDKGVLPPTEDVASDAPPLTEAEFKNVLKKVSQRVSSSDREEKGT